MKRPLKTFTLSMKSEETLQWQDACAQALQQLWPEPEGQLGTFASKEVYGNRLMLALLTDSP